ncbi:hypothetical protein D6C77_04734 [Aureobasidium pullulans]|nr:hypothetical protein D6C77_04734 [Aureobasidium pullulans]
MTQKPSATDVWNDEIYCAICGAGFTQVVDLEFHQSAHDVKFSPSHLAKAADYEGDVAVAPLLTIGHHNPAFPGPTENKPFYPTSENKLRPVHQHAYHQHRAHQLNYQRSHYVNPVIGQPTHYDHPIINNAMQASGAAVYGTAPQRGLPSAAGSAAFWQLLPVLRNDITDGQQVHARPEEVYHLYGSLPRQAPGDAGVESSPDQTSNHHDVSDMGDERSTEME